VLAKEPVDMSNRKGEGKGKIQRQGQQIDHGVTGGLMPQNLSSPQRGPSAAKNLPDAY